jgi:hypothetical protein
MLVKNTEFWRDVDFLNEFLSVKKVKCPIDK